MVLVAVAWKTVAVGGSRSSFEWLTLVVVVACWVDDAIVDVGAGLELLVDLASVSTTAPEAGGW